MTTAHHRITISVPQPLVEQIDSTARAQTRSRSQQIAHLVKAGFDRLAELEAAARTGIFNQPSAGTSAAAAHLRQHAALCGITSEDSEND